MTLFESWPYKWFGIWKGSAEEWGEVPVFSELVDEDWSPHDLEELLRYLRECPVSLASSVRPRPCNLCGDTLDVGPSISDGVWCWPLILEHYVRKHHIRLPDKLVERIRQKKYQPIADKFEPSDDVIEIIPQSFPTH